MGIKVYCPKCKDDKKHSVKKMLCFDRKAELELDCGHSTIVWMTTLSLNKCNRCGVCCSIELCRYGHEGEHGLCRYLLIDRQISSCTLILDGKVRPADIGIGIGCIARKSPSEYIYDKMIMNIKLKDRKKN